MLINKNKLKNKVSEDDYGNPRNCRICNKAITAEDIEKSNFEYSKNRNREIFVHSTCIENEIKESKGEK